MQRTPGMYTVINTQTQRTGLPSQSHSIVFVTGDLGAPTMPTSIYDTASADTISGANSNAGRMMAAALSISQGVRVETVGKSQPSDGSGEIMPSEYNFDELPFEVGVVINNDPVNSLAAFFAIEINGVMYNADKSQNIMMSGQPWHDVLAITDDVDGNLIIKAKIAERQRVRLIPSSAQKLVSNQFVTGADALHGTGAIGSDGSFYFNIFANA